MLAFGVFFIGLAGGVIVYIIVALYSNTENAEENSGSNKTQDNFENTERTTERSQSRKISYKKTNLTIEIPNDTRFKQSFEIGFVKSFFFKNCFPLSQKHLATHKKIEKCIKWFIILSCESTLSILLFNTFDSQINLEDLYIICPIVSFSISTVLTWVLALLYIETVSIT